MGLFYTFRFAQTNADRFGFGNAAEQFSDQYDLYNPKNAALVLSVQLKRKIVFILHIQLFVAKFLVSNWLISTTNQDKKYDSAEQFK